MFRGLEYARNTCTNKRAMTIVPISKENWRDLKNIRLASLRDSPGAFGLSYDVAAAYSDEDWMARALE